MIGIPIGIYEQAKDTVTGIWDLIKSIFSGEILDQLVDLYNALFEMDWEDVKKMLWGLLGIDPDRFDEIWNSKNITTVKRYKFIGEIIGRLIFEIILMVFTGGAALAKYSAKIPALAKLATSLKKVDKVIPDETAEKLRKAEKTTDKVDEAVVPVIVKTEKAVGSMLAPYKKLRGKLDEVKGKIGNENFAKFDEQLRQLPDEVLKKLDDNPGVLEAFAKRSLDDPDFFKAVKKGDLSKLDELIEIKGGKKGEGWTKELNAPLKPNAKYKIDGYLYETDDFGRVKKVSGDLKLEPRGRNTYQQGKSVELKDGTKGIDDGGHLIADRFYGPGEQINYLPQKSSLNKGAWKKMENDWAKAIEQGKKVEVDIRPVFEGSSKRPVEFEVFYKVNGEEFVKYFSN